VEVESSQCGKSATGETRHCLYRAQRSRVVFAIQAAPESTSCNYWAAEFKISGPGEGLPRPIINVGNCS
jgi:hypothetical protein